MTEAAPNTEDMAQMGAAAFEATLVMLTVLRAKNVLSEEDVEAIILCAEHRARPDADYVRRRLRQELHQHRDVRI
jgi:hypothetical protein